jgi:hypothetical protein
MYPVMQDTLKPFLTQLTTICHLLIYLFNKHTPFHRQYFTANMLNRYTYDINTPIHIFLSVVRCAFLKAVLYTYHPSCIKNPR